MWTSWGAPDDGVTKSTAGGEQAAELKARFTCPGHIACPSAHRMHNGAQLNDRAEICRAKLCRHALTDGGQQDVEEVLEGGTEAGDDVEGGQHKGVVGGAVGLGKDARDLGQQHRDVLGHVVWERARVWCDVHSGAHTICMLGSLHSGTLDTIDKESGAILYYYTSVWQR